MSGPLTGIRVLDMGAFSVGPQGCGLLGLLGAEVIRIEPDYGDGLMRIIPYINGTGTTYLNAHHNSKSIVLGLKDNEEEIRIARKLIEKVDILVENRRVGALDRLGFGYKEVSKINPRIIYASSAAYGHTGPFLKYGGADHFIQAMSGFASLNGAPGGPPEWLRYIALVDCTGSIVIAQGCLVALVQREQTGRGQYVDLDELSSCLFMQSTKIAEYFATRQEPKRMGSESPKICPSKAYLTQDNRYVLISALARSHWVNLCSALEVKELADDERFSNNNVRLEHRDEVNRIIQEKIQDKPLVWWLWQLGRYHVPHTRVMGVEDLVQDPFILKNRYILDLPSAWGTLKYPNAPWRFKETPINEPTASPYMDSDRDYVLSLIKKESVAPAPTALPAEPPLKGIRVIDLTQGIAGPICTVLLGSIGAEVIKVEKDNGDFARDWGPRINDENAIFMQLNHDKKGICVDYEKPEGLDILRDLVKTADVLIEDFKPGEAERLGLGYEDLRKLKRDLIYCSIYPYWENTTDKKPELTELEIQGMSGMMKWIGEPGKEPVRMGADTYSSLTGIFTFAALMAAIYNKKKRHMGDRIVTSALGVALYTCAHGILPMSGVDWWEGFWVTSPYDHAETGFKTKTQPIMFGTLTRDEKQARETFTKLCEAVGLGEYLKDPKFVEKFSRTLGMGRAIQEAKPIFEGAFKNWNADDLVNLIDKVGGLAAPLLSFNDLFKPLHEQVKANNMVIEQEHPRAGRIKLVNSPWRHSEGAAQIKTPSPALGEHTEEILTALGYPEARIAQLRKAGIVR